VWSTRLQHVKHLGKSGTAYTHDTSSSLYTMYSKQAQNVISTIKKRRIIVSSSNDLCGCLIKCKTMVIQSYERKQKGDKKRPFRDIYNIGHKTMNE
jgi:hypothetical protein